MAGGRDEESDRGDQKSEMEPTAGPAVAYLPARTSATICAASFGLTAHVESLMRHWAIVMPQPQPHGSSFKRFNARTFCSAVSTVRSRPGISVARALLASTASL